MNSSKGQYSIFCMLGTFVALLDPAGPVQLARPAYPTLHFMELGCSSTNITTNTTPSIFGDLTHLSVVLVPSEATYRMAPDMHGNSWTCRSIGGAVDVFHPPTSVRTGLVDTESEADFFQFGIGPLISYRNDERAGSHRATPTYAAPLEETGVVCQISYLQRYSRLALAWDKLHPQLQPAAPQMTGRCQVRRRRLVRGNRLGVHSHGRQVLPAPKAAPWGRITWPGGDGSFERVSVY